MTEQQPPTVYMPLSTVRITWNGVVIEISGGAPVSEIAGYAKSLFFSITRRGGRKPPANWKEYQ